MSISKFIGPCNAKQKIIDEIDGLMELVMAERAIKYIRDGIEDGRLGKKAPKKIKKQFLKSLNTN